MGYFCYLSLFFLLSCLLMTCWENLLDPLCAKFSCVLVTFPYGVLGQVWYLIVLIPDLFLLSYFVLLKACSTLGHSHKF